MKCLTYQVKFTTPAFLGNAGQSGQWRTPPFKALLRQWWRVVKANELLRKGLKAETLHEAVREEEGKLFGHAWLKDNDGKQWASRAQVTMRLDGQTTGLPGWTDGAVTQGAWQSPANNKLTHREVKNKHGNVEPIDAFLYLGYGPLLNDASKGSKMKVERAVGAQELRSWKIRGTDDRIQNACRLIHVFGAVGGRSRNGWGSLSLDGDGLDQLNLDALLDPKQQDTRECLWQFSRDWKECLKIDWSNAIGTDDKGLLMWRTKAAFKTWQEVMKELARVKIAFRTQFHFNGHGSHAALCDRQIIAYPITKHSLAAWGNQARSSNQVFFKVHGLADENHVGLVAHAPHGLPTELAANLAGGDNAGLKAREEKVWQGVHHVLDRELHRLP